MIALSGWDVALIVSVSSMGLAIALTSQPSAKAAILALPIPFSIAFLGLQSAVGVEHVAALGLLFGFSLAVWLLHERLRLAIVPSIASAAALYLLGSAGLRPLLLEEDFWLWVAAVASGALLFLVVVPPRSGKPQAPAANPVVKLWVLLGITTMLVLLKGWLGGFMTLFPMVGVIAAYENRRHLWWNVRAIPIAALSLIVMLLSIRSLSPSIGLEPAVALSWLPYGGAVVVLLALDEARRRRGRIGTNEKI